MREFVFKDGSSDKFWRIELAGDSFEVTFGKTGTKGQTQTKSFGSAAEAKKAHDALIAEKTKKGYTETGSAGAPAATPAPKATPKPKATPAPKATSKPTEEKAKPEPAAAATAPAATPSSAERRIDLDPLDWHWATWRKLPPLLAPVRPFDLDDCLTRLRKVKQPGKYDKVLDLSKASIRPFMSGEEARFWWLCMSPFDLKKTVGAFADSLAKKKPAHPTTAQVVKALKSVPLYQGKELGYVLSALLEPLDLVRSVVLADLVPESGGHRAAGDVFYGIREDGFQRLTPAERDELREEIRGELTPAKFPADYYDLPSGAFQLAVILGGLSDELGAVVRSWKDDRYYKQSWDDAYQIPQHIVFGLGSAAEVEHEMRRLKLTLRQPEFVRAWLAHTEYGALDYLATTVVAQTNKGVAADLAKLACIVHAPEMVAPMQTILKKSKAPQVALAWLDAHKTFGDGGAAAPADAKTASAPKPAIEGEDELLAALAKSEIDAPDPRVAAIKKKNDPAALDAFAWDLFQGWLVQGAPPKQKWKLMAVGLLGGDASALKLAPLVRAWPGESQHQRAVLGLECLQAIGTDVALMQLSGIALKVKFQALKAHAEAAMNEIAQKRGMSRDDLEDRIVPDGGFDADGKRTFSFGPRSFTATLGPSGAPVVRDEAGEVRDDLPKPGAKDDKTAATAAVEAWKLFKKTVKEAAKIHGERLERAMVTQRAWRAADFDALLVKHPLMGHLARLVLWGTYDGTKLLATFRVAEDRTLAGVDDAAFALKKDAMVRLVHPLALDDKTKGAWSQVFADYEIVAPFEQLGRATFAPTAAEAKSDDVADRFKGKSYDVRAFTSRLRKAGWRHGEAQDAGFVGDHSKPFVGANVVAVLEHNGYPIGSPEYADPQTITHVRFVRPGETGYRKKCLRISEVDAIAFSEVVLDLTNLGA